MDSEPEEFFADIYIDNDIDVDSLFAWARQKNHFKFSDIKNTTKFMIWSDLRIESAIKKLVDDEKVRVVEPSARHIYYEVMKQFLLPVENSISELTERKFR